MLSFSLEFQSGVPVYEQVVYAVKKALVSGLLRPGEAFPSVRKLSQELRMNPNTAHKAVAALVAAGLLEVKPGVGTVVALAPAIAKEQSRGLLDSRVEHLVVEAKMMGLGINDLVGAVKSHWSRLN